MSIEKLGRDLTRGVMLEFGKWFFIGLATIAGLQWLAPVWDETDDRAAGVHSQMRLRTDHGTGCQYLESREGALTPRIGRDGRQVCR